jgi:branched-chain amino acid transport system permease protein
MGRVISVERKTMSSQEFTQTLANGLMLAMLYMLVAAGLALIFSIMHIVNFAHGELYMLGAFVVYYFFGQWGVNYFLALLASMVLVGLLGALLERFLFYRLQAAHLSQVILSLGLMILLQGAATVAFGADFKSVASPFSGVWRWGDVSLAKERLLIIPFSMGLICLLFAFVKWTRMGRAMRAVAQDPEAASLQGISPVRISALAFGIGAALAAAAGGLIVPLFYLTPFIGGSTIMKAFVVIALGGMGSITGVVAGALILGIVDSLATTLFGSTAATLAAFGVLILVLLIRPKGLFGHE